MTGSQLLVRLDDRTLHVRTADDDEALHWALDREGRLIAGHEGAAHHRIGLDASVLTREGSAGLPRRLPEPEGDAVLARAAAALRDARAGLERADARLELGREADALALLARAAARADAPAAERAAYARVYDPVRMVPPDCAQALVVQLTRGCSWGRCTFCSLYAGVPFRRADPTELALHLDGVASLLGAGAALRTRLFLGDANALLAPMDALLSALALARERFPAAARGGADAFVDAFSGAGRTEGELRALREAGLRRVTVGLESGCAPLLRRLQKPSTPARVGQLVRRARAAGLRVGVTVLAGLGGPELARDHVRDTIRVVRGLGLGRDDLVFLSPLVGAAAQGEAPPAPDEVAAQAAALRAGLEGGPWRVTLYDIRRSIH